MLPLAFRGSAYLLAGLSAGLVVWALIYNVPFEEADANRVLAGVILIPSLAVVAVLLWMANVVTGAGARISSVWSILAADLVCLLASAVAVFCVIDGFSERLGGPRGEFTDPLAANVTAIMLLPAALLLALFVTQTGNQSIHADDDGLYVGGPSGEAHAPWKDIASFRPDAQHVLVSRLGFLFPRHLRTNLVVVLSDGETITIFDPGTRRARLAALRIIGDAMPETMRSKLNEMKDHWG